METDNNNILDKKEEEELHDLWLDFNNELKRTNAADRKAVEEIIRSKTKKTCRLLTWSLRYGMLFLLPLFPAVAVFGMDYRNSAGFWIGGSVIVPFYFYWAYWLVREYVWISRIDLKQGKVTDTLQSLNKIYYNRLLTTKRVYILFPVIYLAFLLWGNADLGSPFTIARSVSVIIVFIFIAKVGISELERKIEGIKREIGRLEEDRKG